MSWKSVEMQVALPRTQDAGRIQDQMAKQNQQFQQTLSEQQLKEEKIKQHIVNEYEDVESINKDKEREGSNSQDEESNNNKNEEKESKEQMKHPYLGANIDYSR
ncbi:MAG TPA: hypothetical protein VK042_00230 [Atopostipes sp.]|nr:hypothetical protein [Atopostipes sp.]